ncbi:MAG: hypothetical protein H6892_06140 [Brucellaceae bacterium]|nr:hypothetical protein [Brucellaceae bacterium]
MQPAGRQGQRDFVRHEELDILRMRDPSGGHSSRRSTAGRRDGYSPEAIGSTDGTTSLMVATCNIGVVLVERKAEHADAVLVGVDAGKRFGVKSPSMSTDTPSVRSVAHSFSYASCLDGAAVPFFLGVDDRTFSSKTCRSAVLGACRE